MGILTEKVHKYREGKYLVKPPPVSTIWWNEYDWIKWIDKEGKWLDDKQKGVGCRPYDKKIQGY
jgi:uncharacterized C2H2 Zn-finger protein